MKTKEELYALKNEVEAINKKLAELTEDELKQVSGGMKMIYDDDDPEECSWWEKVLKIFFKY